MQIALVNHSTKLSNDDLNTIARVLNFQMQYHAGPAWDLKPASVACYRSEASVPASSKKLLAFDNADQAGALGYHDETPTGEVYGKVFVQTILQYGGVPLHGPLSVAATFSHEALEMWRDPHINEWAQGPNGKLYAIELGDPVENDYYDVPVGSQKVSVSNFALPAWFDAAKLAGARYDYMGKLHAPFSMTAGGYMIVMAGGKVSEVFGESYPDWKRPGKTHKAARTFKRLQQSQK